MTGNEKTPPYHCMFLFFNKLIYNLLRRIIYNKKIAFLISIYTIIWTECSRYRGKSVIIVCEVSTVISSEPASYKDPFFYNYSCRIKHLKFDIPFVGNRIALSSCYGLITETNPFHKRLCRRRTNWITECDLHFLPLVTSCHPSRGIQERNLHGIRLN